jgi:hypothetical protein
MLLPALAVISFLIMVAVAEYQIRSSPVWPPPARHELGGWQVDDPMLLTLAAGLNLPATVPILWMSTFSDGFAYAIDDHHPIIYLPWTFLVFWLWYFVADHLDNSTKMVCRPTTRSYLVFAAQVFITGELIYCGVGIISRSPTDQIPRTPPIVIACFWG